jgi:hypothetical protein
MKTSNIICKNYIELFKSRWLKTKEIFEFLTSVDTLIINEVVKLSYSLDRLPSSIYLYLKKAENSTYMIVIIGNTMD